jgi:NADH-quinone oxidoreductase subunit J
VVTSQRNEQTKRKDLTTFTYDTSRCMFCGLCEDACPVDALELTQDFELASYTREGADLGPPDARRRAQADPIQMLRYRSSFTAFACWCWAAAILTITGATRCIAPCSLIVSLLGVAGLYLLQQAEFLFAVQIVLYVGGIMVLFLFVIMLVNLDQAAKEAPVQRQWLVALVCGGGGGRGARLLLVPSRRGAFHIAQPGVLPAGLRLGNTERWPTSLFSEYLLPFEIASILLLVAVVGSVVMAKKRI